ncbi:MAG: hypothetical protein V3T03_04840, partial [Candidatus Bipolaricaulota bacterium]
DPGFVIDNKNARGHENGVSIGYLSVWVYVVCLFSSANSSGTFFEIALWEQYSVQNLSVSSLKLKVQGRTMWHAYFERGSNDRESSTPLHT